MYRITAASQAYMHEWKLHVYCGTILYSMVINVCEMKISQLSQKPLKLNFCDAFKTDCHVHYIQNFSP